MLKLATVLVLGALLTGCTQGGANPAASPSSTTTTQMSEVELLALAKEVAQCIRDNGLPGLPDPYFENGELKLPPVDANVEQQGQAILEGPCREIWQRLDAAMPEQQQRSDKDEPRQPMAEDDLAKVREFAKCMRDNGYAAWPDPDPTGFFNLEGVPGIPETMGKGQTPDDARFRDAFTKCERFSVPGMGVGVRPR